MTPLERLVEDTLADPPAAARAHAAGGGRVVGYFTCNVPLELILAADAFPLHLPHLVAPATPLADRYMEPLFDRGARSVFDRWLAGDFDFVEFVVLPRSQDSAQRLYYYMDELLRTGVRAGPRPVLYDLLKVPRPTSESYTAAATERLAATLGVVPGALAASVARVNRRRDLFARLDARAKSGSVPDGAFVARVLRAGLYAPFDAFDAALGAWLDGPPLPAREGPRLALAGSVPPDERLQRAIEQAGGVVAAEHHGLGPHRHGPPVPPDDAPLRAVAHAYHAHVATVRDFGAPAVAAIRAEARLDGVVLWLVEEDEAIVWQVPGIARAAQERGVPLLTLARQDWLAPSDTLTAVQDFVSGLRRP